MCKCSVVQRHWGSLRRTGAKEDCGGPNLQCLSITMPGLALRCFIFVPGLRQYSLPWHLWSGMDGYADCTEEWPRNHWIARGVYWVFRVNKHITTKNYVKPLNPNLNHSIRPQLAQIHSFHVSWCYLDTILTRPSLCGPNLIDATTSSFTYNSLPLQSSVCE